MCVRACERASERASVRASVPACVRASVSSCAFTCYSFPLLLFPSCSLPPLLLFVLPPSLLFPSFDAPLRIQDDVSGMDASHSIRKKKEMTSLDWMPSTEYEPLLLLLALHTNTHTNRHTQAHIHKRSMCCMQHISHLLDARVCRFRFSKIRTRAPRCLRVPKLSIIFVPLTKRADQN